MINVTLTVVAESETIQAQSLHNSYVIFPSTSAKIKFEISQSHEGSKYDAGNRKTSGSFFSNLEKSV